MSKYKILERHKNTKWVVDHYNYINQMDKKLTEQQKIANSELTNISKKYKDTTDKGPFTSYDIKHNYTEIYDKLISPYRTKQNIKLLEIGVRWGGSLLMWKDFLPNAEIYGVDINPIDNKNVLCCNRIHVFQFDAYDSEQIAKNLGDLKFDIIIDDGSHRLQDQIQMINLWHTRLENEGVLIIEDIQNINNAKNIIANFSGPINKCSVIDRTHCVPSLDDINVVYFI